MPPWVSVIGRSSSAVGGPQPLLERRRFTLTIQHCWQLAVGLRNPARTCVVEGHRHPLPNVEEITLLKTRVNGATPAAAAADPTE